MRREEIFNRGRLRNSLELGLDRLKLVPHRITEVGSTDDDHYAKLTHRRETARHILIHSSPTLTHTLIQISTLVEQGPVVRKPINLIQD